MTSLENQKWFVQTQTGTAGPYSLEHLQKLAANGTIIRTTSVRSEDGDNWLRAGQIPVIFRPMPKAAVKVQPAVANARTATSADLKNVSPHPLSQPVPTPRKPLLMYAALGTAVCVSLLLFLSIVALVTSSNRGDQDEGSKESLSYAASGEDANAQDLLAPSKGSSVNDADTADDDNRDAKDSGTVDSQATLENGSTQYSTEQLVSRTSPSVAAVFSSSGGGSGFVVAPGVVATNYHVISDVEIGSDELAVVFPDAGAGDKGPYIAELIAEEPDRDLALLKISCEIPPVKIDETHEFRRGQDVVVIGTPALFKGKNILPNAVTRGVLSSETVIHGLPLYQISNDLNPGNSGGPLFGMDGRVIGVAVLKSLTEDGLNFCIPAQDLAKLVKSSAEDGFAITYSARVQHNARRSVRTLTESTLRLTDWVSDVSMSLAAEYGNRDRNLTGSSLAVMMRDKLSADAPELLKDYTVELEELVESDELSASLRSDLAELLKRHQAIRATLNQPPRRLSDLSLRMDELEVQFMNQLGELNQKLELGLPELFTQ